MATAAVAGVESLAKSVQELSTAASSPPEKYILKDGIGGADFPAMDVAVIALLLTSSSPEKMNCARHEDDFDGYGNDTVFSENQTLDWNDRLSLIVKPESARKLKVWPQNPPNFRKALVDLTKKLEKLDEVTLKAMARYLKGEDEDCFLNKYGENPSALSRFNFYPPCRRPDAVLAAKAHSDASAMTYLLIDEEVEGLQSMKGGTWYKVPIVPKAILVNPGGHIEIMSDGIFKSPTHRVVTNPEKERMTLAIFFSPDSTTEIGPIEELIDEKRPRMFKSVVDYPRNALISIHIGRNAMDVLRL